MEKNKKAKKQTSFMKNVLMLMIAQVAIKILGFLYRLVIINIEGFGDTETDIMLQVTKYIRFY